MNATDLAEVRTEMIDLIANLDGQARRPGMHSIAIKAIDEEIRDATATLVEICALQAGTEACWGTIDRLAPYIAGIRPEQAANLAEAVIHTAGTLAIQAAARSGRPVSEHVEAAAGAVMARLALDHPEAFLWVTAALTVAN